MGHGRTATSQRKKLLSLSIISKWERAHGVGYKTDTTPEKAKENLIQAVADCQNALDSMVYSLLLDRDAIKKKIEEADERAERLYRGKV